MQSECRRTWIVVLACAESIPRCTQRKKMLWNAPIDIVSSCSALSLVVGPCRGKVGAPLKPGDEIEVFTLNALAEILGVAALDQHHGRLPVVQILSRLGTLERCQACNTPRR